AAQSDRVDSGRCHKHRPLGADRGEIAGAHAAVGNATRDHRAAAPSIVRLRSLPGDPERGNRTDPVSLYPNTGCGRITFRPVTRRPSGTEDIAEAPRPSRDFDPCVLATFRRKNEGLSPVFSLPAGPPFSRPVQVATPADQVTPFAAGCG